MADRFLISYRLFMVFFVLIANNAGLVRGRHDEGAHARRRRLVPAMFVFGDSLVDDGNNNFLPTFARANYLPYGIDFKFGPTGRFSNGYTMVDAIGKLLGLPLIPPHSEAFLRVQMRYGVNYASAAAGILDSTGADLIGRIPFNQQIKNFESDFHQKLDCLGPDAAPPLSKSIFFVGIGSNDYLNNYMLPNSDTSKHYNPQQYADLLVRQYSKQLNRLYHLGARKFVISGVGPIGCVPYFIAQSKDGECSKEVNHLVLLFDKKSKAMIKKLRAKLHGSKFSYINIYSMFQDLLANASSYGFSVVNRACCGVRIEGRQINCIPLQIPCLDRRQYVFWDAFHPTQAVNVLFGRKAFEGNKHDVYPMNIQQLAKL